MPKIPPRFYIYTRDVENITGRKRRKAAHILSQIRKLHQKGQYDLVSVKEFCEYMKLEERVVREFLVD
ncbi:MAG TPA: hypothetical protein VHK69_19995 [Chitinophagaceae bacterium]|jgi:hypothetical protein|nr:hypothetical protein [Chitinophagaceae bacterium]